MFRATRQTLREVALVNFSMLNAQSDTKVEIITAKQTFPVREIKSGSSVTALVTLVRFFGA